jgi:hypothetical protein
MKKITITLLILLSIVSVSLSGCLGVVNPVSNPVVGFRYLTEADSGLEDRINNYIPLRIGYRNNSMWMERGDAEIRSLDLFVRNGDVIARITTQLNQGESLDLRGIKVTQFGNTVNIYVPSVEPTNSRGNQVVDIKIGTVSKFSTGDDYIVVVNSNIDREDKVNFRVENGTLTVFKQASVRYGTVKTNGSNVIAIVEIMVPDKTKCSVDEQNISLLYQPDRKFDAYIPVRVSGASQGNGSLEPIYHEVFIGNLSQFSNGKYEIELNGYDVPFIIRNGKLDPDNFNGYND